MVEGMKLPASCQRVARQEPRIVTPDEPGQLRHCPKVALGTQCLHKCGQFLTVSAKMECGQFSPDLADLGHIVANFANTLIEPDLFQIRPSLAEIGPKSGFRGHLFSNFWTIVWQLFGNFGVGPDRRGSVSGARVELCF